MIGYWDKVHERIMGETCGDILDRNAEMHGDAERTSLYLPVVRLWDRECVIDAVDKLCIGLGWAAPCSDPDEKLGCTPLGRDEDFCGSASLSLPLEGPTVGGGGL